MVMSGDGAATVGQLVDKLEVSKLCMQRGRT